VWFKSFGSTCNDGLRQGMFREFQFRQYRLAVLGWFRLGEKHQKRLRIHKWWFWFCLKLSLWLEPWPLCISLLY
jgi:hypothetical protein